MSIENKNFVITGQQAWDSPIGSNCINIAREISRKNRVLYVNPPMDRITMLRKRTDDAYLFERRSAMKKGRRKQLEQVGENIWTFTPLHIIESISILPDGWLYDIFNKRNNRIFAKEIRSAISELKFEDFILFNDGDMLRSFYHKELLDPAYSIYYSRDFFLAIDYWKKHGKRLEPAIMQKSDLVVTNSIYLNERAKKHNDNSVYIGQGCDFDMFDPAKVKDTPSDITEIPSPRIGYIGALTELRLDISLLGEIAKARPEWQIVLIGPEDEAFQNSDLHNIENIHFTGPRPMEKLASYLSGFDVAMNPQKTNELTIGNYPRKIDEYLAMGLPVVATSTQTMSIFKEFTYLGDGSEDYIRLIERALKEDKPEIRRKRREFALDHSWENSVNDLYKAIKQ